MIIDCISDLHGYYPNLQVGDLLVVDPSDGKIYYGKEPEYTRK